MVEKEQLSERTGAKVKKHDVKGKENQEKGKKIMVQNKEMEDQIMLTTTIKIYNQN